MEEDSRDCLPTGHAEPRKTFYPQFLDAKKQNTDSTSSEDSILTQIPLPYHLPADQEDNYPQDQTYVYSDHHRKKYPHFGDLTEEEARRLNPGELVFDHFDDMSKPLDPSSSPYVPTGLPQGTMTSDQSVNQDSISDLSEAFVHTHLNSTTQDAGQSASKLHAPQLQSTSQVVAQGSLYSGPPQGGVTEVSSYGGHRANMQQNAGPRVNMQQNTVQGYPSQYIQQEYTFVVNRTGSNMGSTAQYQGNYGYRPTVDNSQNQGSAAPSHWSTIGNGGIRNEMNPPQGYNSGSAHQYNQGVQQINQPSTNFAQGRYMPSSQPYGQGIGGYGQPMPNQPNHFNAPSNFSHGSTNSSSFSSSSGAPGPVLGPQGFVRTDSPAKMFDESTATTQHRRGTVAGGDMYASKPLNYGSTPVPKIDPYELEFKSEPRIVSTPILRSRRGQTISNIGTFRVNEQVTDSFPGVAGYQSQEDPSKFRGSPPKMGSFNGGPVAVGNLAPVAEHDPFISNNQQLTQNPAISNQLIHIPAVPISANEGQYAGMAFHGPVGSKPMSVPLTVLTGGGRARPTLQEALNLQNLPFVEYCRLAHPYDGFGVVKIRNIPYSVTRPEIMAFLGRNARIVSENEYEPIHIIMERVTSKTLDCYVEFVSFGEAVTAVNRFEINRMGGHGGRLGQRHVEVELSSQEELMKELFPKAKNVKWHGSQPEIIPRDPYDRYNSGFQGFISSEEWVMLLKHVDSPSRSPFSKECPQRPFECLISTLYKFPWYMVDYITITQRNELHNVVKDLITVLAERIDNATDPLNLNPMLLKRVWKAALRCPGFTPVMKDDVVTLANVDEQTGIELGLPPFAPWWTSLWTIGPKPGVESDLLLWYIALIRETTTPNNGQLTLADQAARGPAAAATKLFGDLSSFINYGPDFIDMTLAEVAKCEWTGIENVLRMALTPSLQQGPAF